MDPPPAFLPAGQSLLLSSFRAGLDCLSMQLRCVAPGPANIAERLFGDIMKYAERIFSRQGFIDALTPSEKVMRR